MIYTSGWARNLKSHADWEKWLRGLKKDDPILFQEFIPRGNGCLNSQVECWRFWEATFLGDIVRYDNATHPIKKGRGVFWNSDALHGKVFGSRIVPWHKDLAPTNGSRFIDGHAPIFEPAWSDFDRCFVLVPHGPAFYKNQRLLKFDYQYHRDVNGGILYTIFGEEEESVKSVCGLPSNLYNPPNFLYSESTLN